MSLYFKIRCDTHEENMTNKLKRRKSFSFFFFLIILLFVGLYGIFISSQEESKSHITNDTHQVKSNMNVLSAKQIFKPTSVPSATRSATPTYSVTPTPVLTGYCLNVPVLFYHHIQPLATAMAHNNTSLTVSNDIFDTQMQYIVNNGYTTITAKQLIDALKNHSTLPAKSIVITLDDGYRDNYIYAYPIFQKYHLIANIMLATGLMEGADYLTWGQIGEMKNSGLIYYTDHTWSHYPVNKGTVDKIQYEIQTAKQQIEAHTGQSTDIFTYPYGAFNNSAITLLQQDEFVGAFSTISGKIQCDSFIMTLHRTRIGNAPLSLYGI